MLWNLSELMEKGFSFLVSSEMELFEMVHGGSMQSNHPELAHNILPHLVPPVEVQLGRVQ